MKILNILVCLLIMQTSLSQKEILKTNKRVYEIGEQIDFVLIGLNTLIMVITDGSCSPNLWLTLLLLMIVYLMVFIGYKCVVDYHMFY